MSEINNAFYEEQATSWWQPDSTLSQLQLLNPGRFKYLDRALAISKVAYADCEVLDIGCGGGFICEEFAKRGAKTTGVDPSGGSITEANRHAKSMGYAIDYRVGSGESLPFEDKSFDIVSCCDVLEHVEDLEKVIQETQRVLKPGGIYFYDTINRSFLSWLVMIKVYQDWPLTRQVPQDTHLWKMFIKPEELKKELDNAGLILQHETGLGPSVDWRTIPSSITDAISSKRLKDLFSPFQIGSLPSKQVSYMGWAIKQ